jgi:hypothetical protein
VILTAKEWTSAECSKSWAAEKPVPQEYEDEFFSSTSTPIKSTRIRSSMPVDDRVGRQSMIL